MTPLSGRLAASYTSYAKNLSFDLNLHLWKLTFFGRSRWSDRHPVLCQGGVNLNLRHLSFKYFAYAREREEVQHNFSAGLHFGPLSINGYYHAMDETGNLNARLFLFGGSSISVSGRFNDRRFDEWRADLSIPFAIKVRRTIEEKRPEPKEIKFERVRYIR